MRKIKFTKHTLLRIIKRRILKIEVLEAIKFPDLIKRKEEILFFIKKLKRETIEVCYKITENNIKVITRYWIRK